ncbi:Aminotransferase-like, plant mobile domain [Sesbania bispinosa]|nr:Aminotransferase-like, plant mobile domain [Sesbania bispinosa]
MIDRCLVSAFMERWHRETSNFHLPVGEMTITLDDVFTLLLLPVIGRLLSLPALGKDEGKQLLVSALKVSHEDAFIETEITRGAYARLSWLRDVYNSNLQQRNLNAAASVYLLHLVGCTIFADKSATAVRVTYLELFRDLSLVGNIAWGAATLAYLYEQLKDASCHNTRQLAGYPTLLQAWILEHFPHIMHIERSPDYVDGMPLCRRLRPHRPLLISSSLKSCPATIWSHTRHPPSPHDKLPVPPMTAIHHHYLHYQDHLLDAGRRGPIVTHAQECIHGYLDWFRMVSHPYIMPHQDIVHGPLPPTLLVYREEATSTRTQNSTAHEGITQRLQALLRTDMITVGSDCERLTQEAFNMAQVDLQSQCTRISRTYQRKRRGGDGSTS